VAKYDPKGEYKKKYESLAQAAATKPWRKRPAGPKDHDVSVPNRPADKEFQKCSTVL
jgi:hypothetical protein